MSAREKNRNKRIARQAAKTSSSSLRASSDAVQSGMIAMQWCVN